MVANLAGYMAFILLVNAAITDADPIRKQLLRRDIKPMLEQWRTRPTMFPLIIQRIEEIMGDEWTMDEEHKQSIEQLLNMNDSSGSTNVNDSSGSVEGRANGSTDDQ
jgi:hypothetical protein